MFLALSVFCLSFLVSEEQLTEFVENKRLYDIAQSLKTLKMKRSVLHVLHCLHSLAILIRSSLHARFLS